MLSAIRSSLRVPATLTRLFQTSAPVATEKFDRKRIPADDEGVQGEKIVDLDNILKLKQNIFPTLDSENQLFDGVPYKTLPICNIRVSHNNTIFTLTDSAGVVKLTRSCGIEGFKNAKKGTNIAAQTTAVALATKALGRGVKTVRVKIRGLGPGRLGVGSSAPCVLASICYCAHLDAKRLSAVKGLQMGGLDIVSVTDTTLVSWNGPRPRKARRL